LQVFIIHFGEKNEILCNRRYDYVIHA